MNRKELIKEYLEFFKSKNHKEIPNSSLIPENDPTVLFTTAGMHPIVPYLLGQKHPLGKKLCNVQRCIRTGDIEEVGDEVHHTFFEMLGNWSLGDYWKKEAINYTFEFLAKVLKIPKEKLAVSCFAGDKDASKDEESAKIWKSLGIKRIAFLPKKDNWWGPAGNCGPCGPDTEVFYWTSNKPIPKSFSPKDKNWSEIGNDVLMQYSRDKRLILVDGMDCLYDDDFILNKELLDWINSLNTHTILTVNGFREKGLSLVKNYDLTRDTNWKAFSLEEKEIKKDDAEFFRTLLNQFHLVPEEVIYFDHSKKNVETAQKLGILSKHYTDLKSIKKFIEDNLFAFIPLKQKNVDFGGGVERTLAVLNQLNDNYLTDVWKPIIKRIEKLYPVKSEGVEIYEATNLDTKKSMRIIADHIKASVFIIADGIVPGKKEQGYILRRLIRRAVRYGQMLHLKKEKPITPEIAEGIFEIYSDYQQLQKNKVKILEELKKEEIKFLETLERGIKLIQKIRNKIIHQNSKEVSCKEVFLLYQSYGFPFEMIKEEFERHGIKVDEKEFNKECKIHQELSRTATEGRFKSGLADSSEKTTRLHTASHLLLAALRIVLKNENIIQRGSNITPERLRLDFSFNRKLTNEEIKKVEELVNARIQSSCEVIREEMSPEEARKKGACGIFDKKYGERVSVYIVEDFSKEICAGPHVKNTCELGKFRITAEESSSSGVRRIKAVLE